MTRKIELSNDIKNKIIELYNNGLTIRDISKEFNYSYDVIRKYLKGNVIFRTSFENKLKRFTQEEEKQICEKYLNGMTLKQIGEIYKVCIKPIKRVIIKNNIKIRTKSEISSSRIIKEETRQKISLKNSIHISDENINKICKMYIDNNTISQISSHFGFSNTLIGKILKQNNICIRKLKGKTSIPEEIQKQIIECYNKNNNIPEICKKFDLSYGKIHKFLKNNGIKINRIYHSGKEHPLFGTHPSSETIKKSSESHKNWFKTHKHQMKDKKHKLESIEKMKKSQQKRVNSFNYINSFYGKTHNDVTRKILSIKNIERNFSGSRNPMYGKHAPKLSGIGHGEYYITQFQGLKWMRSSYEIAYACYLDSIGEPWYYEYKSFPMVINSKETTYSPDFWLPNQNKFIEIKGRYNYNKWEETDISKVKFNKFKSEFCNNFSCDILFTEDLKNLGIKL